MKRRGRVGIRVQLDLVHEEPVRRIIQAGKKVVFTIPHSEALTTRVQHSKPIRVAVWMDDLYDAPDQRSLEQARCAVRALLPESIRVHVRHIESVSWTSLQEWHRPLLEAVLELAQPVGEPEWNGSRRAFCPLCGEGTQDFMNRIGEGFALPEGLRRHLIGQGNTRECDVMRTLYDWALDIARH